MSRKTLRGVLVSAAFTFVATSAVYAAHEAGALDVEAAKRAIRIADLELAKSVADRNLEKFVALVGEDAVFFGRDVARGKEAVAKAWLPYFTDSNLFLEWRPVQIEVSSSADLGYSIGEYRRTTKGAGGKPETATGSYVSIWRKHPDGNWKAVLDIGTPGTPLPQK